MNISPANALQISNNSALPSILNHLTDNKVPSTFLQKLSFN